MRRCKMIVWNEVTISHKKAFEALDKTLKDIGEYHFLLGDGTVRISGNFRQCLPVLSRDKGLMNACIKFSPSSVATLPKIAIDQELKK